MSTFSGENHPLVPRKRIEQIIIQELRQKLLTTENLEYTFKNIEKLAAAGLNEVPELTQKKKAQMEKLKTEIQNYMNFIRMGNISNTVSEALSEAEKKNEELTHEIEGLEFQKNNTFKAPPKEWLDHRLANLRDTLNKDTINSALALKELLGTVTLEPILTKESDYYRLFEGTDRNFKPYYVAHTKIQTLALLEEEDKGSNWRQWWRCRETTSLFSRFSSTNRFYDSRNARRSSADVAVLCGLLRGVTTFPCHILVTFVIAI